MENKQSAEQTEHFGIGRTKWRITILVIFFVLGSIGQLFELNKRLQHYQHQGDYRYSA